MNNSIYHCHLQPYQRLFIYWNLIACLAFMPSSYADHTHTPASQSHTQSHNIKVNDKYWYFGMSTALTGPTRELGTAVRDGVLLGFHHMNDAGGIQGKPLRLQVLDDGYEPHLALPNVEKLLADEKILGIIGNIGTPTSIAVLPLIEEHKIVFFAPVSGSMTLRRNSPYIIHYRASYQEEMAAMVDALVQRYQIKLDEIAFFSQRDSYGDAGVNAGFSALKQHGLSNKNEILHVRYERNSLAVENALADILLAPKLPKAIIMVGAYAPCAKFIRLAKQYGLEDTLFLNVSFVGGDLLARHLGSSDYAKNVIVTQVVPHYNANTALTQTYLAELKRFMPMKSPSFASLEGYIAARILGLALLQLDERPSRNNLIQALKNLGEFDIGSGQLFLSQQDLQASHSVWATLLKDGKTAPFSWSKAELN